MKNWKSMEKKEKFSTKQLKLILRILVWGTVIGGFLIWLFLPWDVPVYHKGMVYYEGSKLPLLILLPLPFFAFLRERSDLEEMEKRKGLKEQIAVAVIEAVVVFAMMIGVWLASR